MSKTTKLLKALQEGAELTPAQITARFGFGPDSVRSVVSQLRRRGFAIYANPTRTGVTKYRLGTPSRAVVAAGYSVLGA